MVNNIENPNKFNGRYKKNNKEGRDDGQERGRQCPECGSVNIAINTIRAAHNDPEAPKWKCTECNSTFD